MFCSKCGSEIPDGSKFCIKCGATTTAQNGSVPPPVRNSQGGTYTANNADNGIRRDYKAISKNYFPVILVIAVIAAIVVIVIIMAILNKLTTDPIIGKYTESDYIYHGISSAREDPSYLKDRKPDKVQFFKDGSVRYTGGYDWEGTSTGTWENITTEADSYPTYIVTIDGESATFFKGTRDSLSLRINKHEIRVFDKD